MNEENPEIPLTEFTIHHQDEETPRVDKEVLGYFAALVAKVPQEELDAANYDSSEGLVFRIEVWMDSISAQELAAIMHYIAVRSPDTMEILDQMLESDPNGAYYTALEVMYEEDEGDDDDE